MLGIGSGVSWELLVVCYLLLSWSCLLVVVAGFVGYMICGIWVFVVVFLCRLVSCGLRTIVGCGGCGFFVDLCCLLLFWVLG